MNKKRQKHVFYLMSILKVGDTVRLSRDHTSTVIAIVSDNGMPVVVTKEPYCYKAMTISSLCFIVSLFTDEYEGTFGEGDEKEY